MSVAGKTASSQTFALATAVTAGLLNSEISGIAGLGFQSLSTSQTPPLWSNVGLTSGAEEFAFFLNRQIQTAASSDLEQYGGVFSLGGANSTLYQGAINWSNVINKAYWLITLGGASVNGVNLDVRSTNKAAIDTGTTLIGGPSSVISALYAQIPGAQASASSQGYYEFPCDTAVNTTLTFGDQQYAINTQDFVAGATNRAGTTCMGAFFDVGSDANTRSLQWIVGDAFLKGVYSVFQVSALPRKAGPFSVALTMLCPSPERQSRTRRLRSTRRRPQLGHQQHDGCADQGCHEWRRSFDKWTRRRPGSARNERASPGIVLLASGLGPASPLHCVALHRIAPSLSI